ncbi:hypothetical protein DET49_104142 [Salegentibacter sp. 24]|uniref:hypothetical protein n=1 Tax=Salegentibacter sp. 24 TaxID=2183986 RepID=UPI00105BA41C|nr:hypothetical protein [Salegentibacter sp. 24]TDN93411.1 hypothetical protein DET49_104142 [Salegentibacter sp. 24]
MAGSKLLADLSDPDENVYIWHFAVDKTAEILYQRQKRILETEYLQKKEQNRFFIEENSDAFILLEEKYDLKIQIEATLSQLLNREIRLEWDSGRLMPMAYNRDSENKLKKWR